jgi:hypothetical protein
MDGGREPGMYGLPSGRATWLKQFLPVVELLEKRVGCTTGTVLQLRILRILGG